MVVDVVGQAVDTFFKALLRIEVGIFTAGHVSKDVGDVAAECVDQQENGLPWVGRGTAKRKHLEQIVLAGIERDGVDDGVGAGEVGGDEGGMRLGAVVAGLADEQDGAAVVVRGRQFVEELVCVVDGIERAGRPFRRRRAGGW